jgi:pyruvate carboxylase subunit B
MNLYSRSMDEAPFTRMDPAMWGMILGKSGKLPGELAPEIVKLAEQKGFEFYTGDPQALYPDELPRFEKEMAENGWDRGQDDEELFEFAMHEKQYREFKSGQAKEQFRQDLIERMRKAGKPIPQDLLPKGDDDMAAVATALQLYFARPSFTPVIRRHATAWNRHGQGIGIF